MKNTRHISTFFFFFCSFFWLPGIANSNAPIQLNIFVFEEVTEQDKHGQTVLNRIDPTRITPRDTVLYLAEYRNNSTQTINHVAITIPIPEQLTYLPNSATQLNGFKATSVIFSIDHGKTFDLAKKLLITDELGKKHPASANDYTHVRWTIPSIEAGHSGSVQFSAQLK